MKVVLNNVLEVTISIFSKYIKATFESYFIGFATSLTLAMGNKKGRNMQK